MRRLPEEPTRETKPKSYHIIFTIFRDIIINPNEQIESFQKELAEFLDVGYTVLSAGKTDHEIYAIVTKDVLR